MSSVWRHVKAVLRVEQDNFHSKLDIRKDIGLGIVENGVVHTRDLMFLWLNRHSQGCRG